MRNYQVQTVRSAMSWVHAWGGLLFGWLLFAVFVLGTLSYFRQEINLWMIPELQQASMGDPQSRTGLENALNYLQREAPEAGRWSIELPNPRGAALALGYGEAGQRRGGVQLLMDPQSGDIIEPRVTAGGDFLYHFHYQLYGMEREIGQWIVGIATMVMFVAIITGIIVHKNIIKDFFTFRPGKGKRSWLDAHNASAVLGLPFMLVITFSGLLLLGIRLMPAAELGAYAGTGMTMRQDMRGGAPAGEHGPAQREQGNEGERAQRGEMPDGARAQESRGERGPRGEMPDGERAQENRGERGQRGEMPDGARAQENRGDRAQRGEMPNGELTQENRGERVQAQSGDNRQENRRELRGEASPGKPSRADVTPVSTVDNQAVFALLQQARAQWPQHGVQRITIDKPGQAGSRITLQQAGSENLSGRGMPAQLVFDAHTGQPVASETRPVSVSGAVNGTLQAIHLGFFAQPLVRWLLFLSGIGGSLMVATGLVLWVVTNGQKQAKNNGKIALGDRLVEILNIGSVAGLLLAVAGYFWANRLIPVATEDRAGAEISVFFMLWGMSFIYAMVRRHKAAWTELLVLTGALTLLLPVLNGLSGGAHLGVSIARGQWQVAAFDTFALLLGAGLLYAARRVWLYQPRARSRAAQGDDA